MTTLAEFMIITSTDNPPPMLEKSLNDSWKSRMELYIENWENGRMILSSVQNSPLVWPTVVGEDGTTRTKRYEELSVAEKLQANCDLKATNIVLQGLPPDVYAILNHHKVAKEIWDKVKLLMQGTKLSLQEKECKLYDEFDKFSFVKGETLHSSVPPSQQYQSHLDHQTAYVPPIPYNPPQSSTQPMTEFPQMDSGFAAPVFNQGDDPIACLYKAMAFLTAVASSRFPSTNNQLRTSFNLRNQAIIQDGKVTMQQVQGRQGQSYAGTSYKGNATSFWRNNAGGQTRVVKCYNCQGEVHESGQILDEEQLAFLADPGILDGQAAQTTIPNTPAFQTEDLDAYGSNYDDVSNAKAVLMANLSNYGSDVISKCNPDLGEFFSWVEHVIVHSFCFVRDSFSIPYLVKDTHPTTRAKEKQSK
ncbi:hypothetical protein Tco_0386252, partial [Tanacetum coccineum]